LARHALHWMLNVVTGPVSYPAAVLLRSAGGITGPGRSAKALDVTGTLNGCTAAVRVESGFPLVTRADLTKSSAHTHREHAHGSSTSRALERTKVSETFE
jgi:3-methyladenine DNA glycosylase Mpg